MNIVKRAVRERMIDATVATVLLALSTYGISVADRAAHRAYEYSVLHAPVVLADTKPWKVAADQLISKMDQKELNCATAVIWYEARGESYQGQRAVLAVMQNRMKEEGYPSTYCGVAADEGQFEGIERYGFAPAKRDRREFERMKYYVADWILFGYLNPVADADHYHASWMKKYPAWSREFTKVASLGKHIFYSAR